MSNQKKQSTAVVAEKKSNSPWTQKQVELITKTVAKGADIEELHLFLYTAKKVGLDPLVKQIHFVKRAGQMTIQTGIDGYRAIAERTKQLAGIDDAIFDGGKDHAEKEPTNPSKATVTVYRMVEGQKVPFTATARWKEYHPGEKQGFMWKKMPYAQLAKCAEALALRKAFPNDLSGLYTAEEMEQAGPVDVMDLSDKKDSKIKPEGANKIIVEEKKETKHYCHSCDIEITKVVADYSTKIFGEPFCRECQKTAERINN